MTKRKIPLFGVVALGLALLGPACGTDPGPEGAAGPAAVGTKKQALTTASTTDIINSIIAASQQLQAAAANLNDVISGAYATWPSKAEFQAAYTIRGYNNDLDALNAVSFVSAAYAQGAYIYPSLDSVERQQLGAAYAMFVPSARGTNVVAGASMAGFYVTPRGSNAGAYVSGVGMHGLSERVHALNRE